MVRAKTERTKLRDNLGDNPNMGTPKSLYFQGFFVQSISEVRPQSRKTRTSVLQALIAVGKTSKTPKTLRFRGFFFLERLFLFEEI